MCPIEAATALNLHHFQHHGIADGAKNPIAFENVVIVHRVRPCAPWSEAHHRHDYHAGLADRERQCQHRAAAQHAYRPDQAGPRGPEMEPLAPVRTWTPSRIGSDHIVTINVKD